MRSEERPAPGFALDFSGAWIFICYSWSICAYTVPLYI